MGNCLRNGSSSVSSDHRHHHHRFPTETYASSTVYGTGQSQLSDGEVNSDTNTVYSSAKSHFLQTMTEGNKIPHPSVRDAWRLKAFTFSELEAATGNFSEQNLLGEGGLGKVFRGWIHERSFARSMPVAVKKLKPERLDQLGIWEPEVSILGRLSHPNLMKLLGLCSENVEKTKELLLVYGFMPNGSLADHLFRKNPPTLSWNLRLKIAIGAGRGMAFLHMSQVIHGDFNPSNILLDGNFNPKLSGFGLARERPPKGNSHLSTLVRRGSYGYAAPEYIETGCLSMKSDAYGFGVVLLEMMTGLRAMDENRLDREKYLVDWLKPTLSDTKRVKDIMDGRMEGQYSSEAVLRAAQITSRCLEQNPHRRPRMAEVVEVLEQIESMKE